MTLEKVLTASKAFLCIALACSIISIPFILNWQLTSLRNDAKIQINATRTETIGLVNTRFDSLQASVTNWLGTADHRIASLQKDTFQQLADLRGDTFARIDVLSNT